MHAGENRAEGSEQGETQSTLLDQKVLKDKFAFSYPCLPLLQMICIDKDILNSEQYWGSESEWIRMLKGSEYKT